MKTYEVQVRLSHYVWVTVEAYDEHSAKDQAVRKSWREMNKGYGVWGEEPQVMQLKEGVSE